MREHRSVAANGNAELYSRRVLLFIETTNRFGRALVEGIDRFALENRWFVGFEQRGRFDPIGPPSNFIGYDGVVSRTFLLGAQEALQRVGLPTVELVGGFDASRPIEVTMDEEQQARMVFDHFFERGLRNFAFFDVENAPIFATRRNAFANLVAERGFRCHTFASPWRESNYVMPQWREELREPLSRWLADLPKPIGLYAGVDQHAKIILDLCNELEIAVPRQIAVVGVENDEWFCRIQRPPLSSVDTSGFAIGYEAARLLQAKMDGTYRPRPTIFVPTGFLAVRESSDFYAIDNDDVCDALAFIRENACVRIEAQDVADAIDVSRRSLYRLFERYLGRTPQEEILRVRIESAKTLLRETTLLVSAIGFRVGFSSPEYFVRAFRRETGATPNRYRNQALRGSVELADADETDDD